MLKDRVYDNGFAILGIVYNVKEYLCRYAEETWEIEDVINRLEDLDEFYLLNKYFVEKSILFLRFLQVFSHFLRIFGIIERLF